jgi:hypothetical protein
MRVTAANWSQLAEQARAMVDDMDDALAKKTLLEIAAGYDRLTARALARQRGRAGQPPRNRSSVCGCDSQSPAASL